MAERFSSPRRNTGTEAWYIESVMMDSQNEVQLTAT